MQSLEVSGAVRPLYGVVWRQRVKEMGEKEGKQEEENKFEVTMIKRG